MSDLREGQVIRLADGRNAVVRFVGDTAFAPGIWVGVELDDGNGKNDGSVQGERYFDCAMGNGMFVRPTAVTVVEQPKPKPKAATAARKSSTAARPNSMFASGARTPSGSIDIGVGRRRSLNAPSPSPGPRQSRPGSIARVSTFRNFCVI
jgi:dynactin 1